MLYVEKKGRGEVLRAAGFGEKYDMALVGGEGYASEAIRDLFARAEGGDYQLFVLHDADHSGYNIARTLREETARMPGYSVDVIDIGLFLEDALALGKRPETYTRRKQMDEAVEASLTDVERQYFTGEEHRDANGKPYWIAQRVELNDLSSPQLVEYVERKLVERGVRGKVVPPEGELPDLAEDIYRDEADKWAESVLEEALDWNAIKKQIAEDLMEKFKLGNSERYIRARFKNDDTLPWRDALRDVLADIHDAKHTDALNKAVRHKLTEAIENTDEGINEGGGAS